MSNQPAYRQIVSAVVGDNDIHFHDIVATSGEEMWSQTFEFINNLRNSNAVILSVTIVRVPSLINPNS